MENKTHKGLTFGLLYNEKTIAEVNAKLAGQINSYLAQLEQEQGYLDLVVVCVLKGSFMFYADIARLINYDQRNVFIRTSSYVGTQSTGQLKIETPIKP